MIKQASAPRKASEGGSAITAGPTVYFDGGCPVCTREIAAYRRQPGAESCTWLDVSRCSDSELGVGLTREAALARLHVRQPDGRLEHGAQGFAALWSALPRTAWLGRVARLPVVAPLLEAAYRAFLVLRPLWRPSSGAAPSAGLTAWPADVAADLRSDHAGEAGAVQIYRGVLAVASDPALRSFAQHHRATEEKHLRCIERHLPAAARSRLLPAWRAAGWATGALPALFGPGAVYATVAAVETFVDRHYQDQIDRIDRALPGLPESPIADRLLLLRADLEACRQEEVQHRDEAKAAGATTHPLVRPWVAAVAGGSALAVALARRI